jgi:CheY-like chemotaxis protein
MPTEKILIVDDERLVRWSLRQKCEEWGYHVVEAEAGEPGLKLAQHGIARPGAARRAPA